MSSKFAHWEPSCFMGTDRRTDTQTLQSQKLFCANGETDITKSKVVLCEQRDRHYKAKRCFVRTDRQTLQSQKVVLCERA